MGIKYIYLIFILNFISLSLNSQGLLNNGARINFKGAARMYIAGSNGHYTSQSTGSITPSSTSIITLLGNWVNNSSNVGFSIDSGVVILAGGLQTIGGLSPTAFYNLTLSGNDVKSLAVNSTTVGGQSIFSGVLAIGTSTLDLNGNRLNITNSLIGAITSGATGYIISETDAAVNPSIIRWYIRTRTGAHVYPFGVGGLKIPFTFNVTGAMTATDYVDVSTRATQETSNLPWAGASNVAPVTHMNVPNGPFADGSADVVIDRWWDISPSGTPTANVTFSYRGIENTLAAPFNTGNIGAQYWNGTGWLLDNSSYGSTPIVSGAGVVGSVTATGLKQFCPWVLSSSLAPLPIELINFEANCINNETVLKWCTASEKNNHYFTVEQSSNGIDFIDIGTIHGNGTTVEKHCYEFIVNSSISYLNYYRLRQTDMDNKSTLSKIITIESCDKKFDNVVITNNGSHQIEVIVNASMDYNFDLNIRNSLGQTIDVKHIEAKKGFNSFTYELNYLANGVYYVFAFTDFKKLSHKKIVLSDTGY